MKPKTKGIAPAADAPSRIEPTGEMINASLVHKRVSGAFICGATTGKYGSGWNGMTCPRCIAIVNPPAPAASVTTS